MKTVRYSRKLRLQKFFRPCDKDNCSFSFVVVLFSLVLNNCNYVMLAAALLGFFVVVLVACFVAVFIFWLF